MFKSTINNIKKSTVFLWFMENWKERIIWTWFLVQIKWFFHLVTAKHVVENNWENLCAFTNWKQFNNIRVKPLSLMYNDWLRWISHKNKNVDIAILPFLLDKQDDVQFIPDDLFIDNTEELYELVDVFYTSYQPLLNTFQIDWCINPIVRKWTISRINNDDTFFIDWSAFPWNSWSPVFLFPTPYEFSENWKIEWWQFKIKLLWVMWAYIPYEDVAISQQTWRTKVIFDENTWLSLIHSSSCIKEIINSDIFKEQLDILIQKTKSK